MTSPVPPSIPDPGTTERLALSPSSKMLLAGSVILLGSVVAWFHGRPSLESFENKAIDPNLISAPIPSGTMSEPPGKISGASPNVLAHRAALPALSRSPAVDSGNEKYVQAYPPPILVADETLKNDAKKKTGKKEKSADIDDKPLVSIDAEFKPVHSFPKPVSIDIPDCRKEFTSPPKSISSTQTFDTLLPLFQFAENHRSASPENATAVMPENPFLATSPSASLLVPLYPVQSNSKRLEPLKPLANKPLAPLNP